MKLYANLELVTVASVARKIAVSFSGEGRRRFWKREEAFLRNSLARV